MAEISGFFNSYEGDRRYYVSFLAEYFSSFIGNGVFWGGDYLKVEPYGGNMDVTVNIGKGWINGYYYANKAEPKTLSLDPAHLTLSRIDAVVLQLDLTDDGRKISALVKKGTPSENPVCPDLQRDDAKWELKLAEVRVNSNVKEITTANITDYRLNEDACGVVTNFVPNGFSLQEVFNQYVGELEERMNLWNKTRDDQASQWNAQMTDQDTQYKALKSDIEAWYAEIKADISKLKTFDFDNVSELNGSTKQTEFKADGSISEMIKITQSNKLVATRNTTFTSTGSIVIEIKVYEEDGQTILKSSTTTTTFSGNTISEVIE